LEIGGVNVFKEMRRNDKMLTNEEMLEIMNTAQYGVMSTIGEDGFPYGVPVSFVYNEGAIYFHAALVGHKLENIAYNSKVSFCVIEDVSLMPEAFNTKFKSVIAFGEVTEVEDDKKEDALVLFLHKFSKDFIPSGMEYIKNAAAKAKVFKIEVQHMTAKGKK
jgi:nitroimidazol reductase NimA-like FMN-containing flavoprotein (pyridoxamine 5'-phosphate oxidase superfamily)